jgi:integrase
MGVKLRQRRNKWYIVIDYKGRRKSKCIGVSKAVAEDVRRKVEAKLALGDLGVFADESEPITFGSYADKWLNEYASLHLKESSAENHRGYVERYVKADFGNTPIKNIQRAHVKAWLASLVQKNLARNTMRLALCSLRVVLAHAVEDGIIEVNPAARLGRFTATEQPARAGESMAAAEAELFLVAVRDRDPDYYPLFLVALRCGLRQGELIALRWSDIQIGATENDRNRFIFVQRNCSHGKFTTPKSRTSRRRVDISKQVRAVLAELKDQRLLAAMMRGKESIADDLVFPARSWEKKDRNNEAKLHGRDLDPAKPIDPANLVHYHFQPALDAAGLRRFRFHDLRHTFGSLLAQAGAPLVYIKEQMGHSSIRITADCYAHLQPTANIDFVDMLDKAATPRTSATQTQTGRTGEREEVPDDAEVAETIELLGGPGRIRTYNQQIMSLLL